MMDMDKFITWMEVSALVMFIVYEIGAYNLSL